MDLQTHRTRSKDMSWFHLIFCNCCKNVLCYILQSYRIVAVEIIGVHADRKVMA